MKTLSLCKSCHESQESMRTVFLWFPTCVYSSPFMRDGWRWLRLVKRDSDGKHYIIWSAK